MKRLALAAVALVIVSACSSGREVEVRGVVRNGRTGREIEGALVRGPGDAETHTDEGGLFTLRVPAGEDRLLRAAVPELCPGEARIDAAEGAEATIHLFPRLELDDTFTQVGFDQDVTIEVKTRCDREAPIRFRQVSGATIPEERIRFEENGRKIIVHTHPLAEIAQLDDRLSVVALSRRERGDYRFELEVELGGQTVRHEVRITAAAASIGNFQVPTGAAVVLNGGDGDAHTWTLTDKPQGSMAHLSDPSVRNPTFTPDRFGAYLLTHEQKGIQFLIQAGAYQDVPRDCGREGCHRPEDEGWQRTAHARTFRRGLEGELGPEFEERCWSCHATGVDRGVQNGGLHETARRIGWEQPEPHAGAWQDAPRQVRRHGSVWCSACHGPGRILPPQFHWEYGAKFQAGVCARCHDVVDDPDANHVSPQFREWALAPMSQFIRELAPDDPALVVGCSDCHSAQGFIHSLDQAGEWEPQRSMAASVTCTSCHDPHDASRPSALRVHDAVADIAGSTVIGLGTGAICATCHRSGVAAASDASHAPHAPQASVLLGRGARASVPATSNPHAGIANTCVACHMARPPEGDAMWGGAGGHTFSVRDLRASSTGQAPSTLSAAACGGCHGTEIAPREIGGTIDRDGDGTLGTITDEFVRAFGRVQSGLDARIAAAHASDRCETPNVAATMREYDARLVLATRDGRLLGDCDGDGRLGETETAVPIPTALYATAWDVSLLEKDGSRGLHNPTFTFGVLRRLEEALSR